MPTTARGLVFAAASDRVPVPDAISVPPVAVDGNLPTAAPSEKTAHVT